MNAIVSTPNRPAALTGNDRLLRVAVRLDAWVSGAFGVALLAGAGLVGAPLGMPTLFLSSIGGVCLIYAGVLWLVQTRSVITPSAGWTIVIGNSLWVIASVLLVVLGWLPVTPIGGGFVLLQAILVGALAYLQWLGLRRAGD